MSITIGGILKYQSQKGLALLECDLGKFIINDSKLNDLPCGNHEGLFEINKVAPFAQATDRGLVLEIAAELVRFALVNPLPKKEDTIANKKHQQDIFNTYEQKASDNCFKENDSELFEYLWPLGDSVKLDFTIDRDTLRKQTARLRELGYSFNKDQQVWLKN